MRELHDLGTFRAPISERLALDYWQVVKCEFLAEEISDIKSKLQKLLPQELGPTATVSFSQNSVDFNWDGVRKSILKPEQKPTARPHMYRSKKNPFLYAKGEELREMMAHCESEEFHAQHSSRFPLQTKRTCQIWAQARHMEMQKQQVLMRDEALRCLAWEWPGAILHETDRGVCILRKGIRLDWPWGSLLQEAQA